MSGLEEERLARVALCLLSEPGLPRLAHQVAVLGPVRVYHELRSNGAADRNGADVAERLRGLDPVGVLEAADRIGMRYVIPGDEEWPVQLEDLDRAPVIAERGGAPLGLWVRGPVHLGSLPASVAVVGSRSSTSYGDDVARDLSQGLAAADVPVISGAAFGIDQAAHRGAVAGDGVTVAVLACGADRVYPVAHRGLIEHLAEHGAVVSETPPKGAAMRTRFLARNRIIAGLASGTVVVEAATRSGALNTANWTNGLSRPLMGYPGPVTSEQSSGVHALLRNGASVVTSADDVLEIVGRPGEHLTAEPRGPERVRDRLTLREQQVLDAVPVAVLVRAPSIARTCGIAVTEVERTLLKLRQSALVEFDGEGWCLTELARA